MVKDLDIRSLDLKDAWNFFKTEVNLTDEEYRKARFGINKNFDINDYFQGHIIQIPKSGQIQIRRTRYSSEEFYTELELRERIIKEWLLKNFGEENSYEGVI